MTRSPRPISARARILGAILAVACIGLAIVGSVTFLVQRERVINDVDDRLRAQVQMLETVAGTTAADTNAGTSDTPTAVEGLDRADYSTVREYLHAAVALLVTGRNESSLAVIDGKPRYRPATLSGFDISQESGLIERAVAE